jgi:DNA-binding NarL/FixJ family response regulator
LGGHSWRPATGKDLRSGRRAGPVRLPGAGGAAEDGGQPTFWASSSGGLSVLILDSEQALAQALAAALLRQKGITSTQAASDPDVAVTAMEVGGVDVMVAGIDSEYWDPLALIGRTVRRFPDLAVVAMSGIDDPNRVTAALHAGAVSWVPKRVGIGELAAVVVGAARGESFVPPVLLRQVLRRLALSSAPVRRESVFTTLTAREGEILEYATDGLNREEIAAELGVSINTVRTHIQHILSKLGVHTTLEAVALVLRERFPGAPGRAPGK